MKQDGTSTHPAFVRGDRAFQLGHFEEAIAWFKQVLLELPNDFEALFALGNSYFEAGKLLKAERSYLLCLTVAARPDIPGIRVNLGNTLLGLERYPAAIEQYRQVPTGSVASDKAKRNLALAQELMNAPPKRSSRGRR